MVGCATHTTYIEQNPNIRPTIAPTKEMVRLVSTKDEKPIFQLEDQGVGYFKGEVAYGGESLRFDYYRSDRVGEKHLVFVYQILNDANGTISNTIKDVIISQGYDCIVIQQENFLNRKWTRPILPDDSGHDSYDAYTAKLVRGVGRIIHYWLPYQETLSGKYGFVGISMGGIHAISAASLFPEASITVAIMAGGGNAELFRESQEKLVVRNRENLFKLYAERLGLNPAKKIDFEAAEAAVYRDIGSLQFDILRISRCVDTEKIKLMISLYDKSVPTKCQWNLYYALGEPEARTFPTGHYTIVFYYFIVRDQLIEWLAAGFAKN